jgi:hypothetical protein
VYSKFDEGVSELVQVIKVFLHNYKICIEFIQLMKTRKAKVDIMGNEDFLCKGPTEKPTKQNKKATAN